MNMNASYKFDNGQSSLTHRFPAKTARKKEGNGHWLVAYRKTVELNYKHVYKRVKEAYKKQKNCGVNGGRILNKDTLLQIHCVDEPFELSIVDIVDQHFNGVTYEDLTLFHNVIHVDASVNILSLDHFRHFVSLRELNLSLNSLKDMTFDPSDFPHLEVLDLSFNSLSGAAIAAIGRLSRLRVLHLTENQLYHLPLHLNHSNHDTTELKHLNLKGNVISEVPLLELLQQFKTLQASSEHSEPDGEKHENIKDNLLKLMQFIQQKDWEEYKEISFPFPELQFLNISGNKIAEEEALLAVALFPTLSEIDISSNPLTTQRSGDPPLLKHYLQDKLGVKIKRRNEQGSKTLAKVSVLPKCKADNAIPTESKRTGRWNDQSHVETKETVTQVSPDVSEHKAAQPFFVTEIEDDFEVDLKTIEESAECLGSTSVTDPLLVEPIGIQTAVRMLEHTLKNLNVYRDSKPKLDSIQTPYREKEKRIKALPPPPALPLQQQSKQFDRMIDEIKLNRTTREVPLSKVIKGADGNKQDYKEAVSLLNDMKAKYTMVHSKTMKQAVSLWTETDTEQPTD